MLSQPARVEALPCLYSSSRNAALEFIRNRSNSIRGYSRITSNAKNKKVKVTITLPRLQAGTTAGAGDISIASSSNLEGLKLVASGSGSIITTGELQIKDLLTAKVTGSGSIKVRGTAERSEVGLSGSGFYEASNLETNSSTIIITGSGSVQTHTTKQLVAQLSGSGNLYYKGKPVVQKKVSGSGRVRAQ